LPVSGAVYSIVPLVAEDDVVPRRRVRVLEVGHEDPGAGVQRVDDHLAVDGAGDLDAAVEEVGRQRRDGPRALAHRLRLVEEARALAGVEAALPVAAAGQQLVAPAGEVAHEPGHEIESVSRQDRPVGVLERTSNLEPARETRAEGHGRPPEKGQSP
jgi:hypothetical protein